MLNDSMNELFRVPVSEIVQTLQGGKDMKYLVLDGIITQRLVDTALKTGVKFVVGHRITDLKKGHNLTLRTFDELGIN